MLLLLDVLLMLLVVAPMIKNKVTKILMDWRGTRLRKFRSSALPPPARQDWARRPGIRRCG